MDIGFSELLTVALLVLKLTGVIEWSWFWVFAPVIFKAILIVILIVLKILSDE